MEQKKVTYNSLKDIPDAAWEKLSGKKIYFGHQSVGYNIIGGIEELIKENPKIKLKLKETYNPSEFEPGTLAHSRIGYNNHPESKLDAFEFYMNAGGAEVLDISTFKFCYVDFNRNTNVERLFKDYCNAIQNLKKHYPNTVFVYSTVPLKTIQTGVKAWIKKMVGKPIGGMEENIKRNEFNELIRNKFKETDPIFDIAKIESTFPDGKKSFFEKNGKKYYTLVTEYTKDGGHLNKIGSKKVAEQLLMVLVNLP